MNTSLINGILYLRLVVANYWEFSSSKIVQILCKCYCVIYISISVYLYFSLGFDANNGKAKYDINMFFFFIVNGVFALWNKQVYLTRFNSGIMILDRIMNFNKPKLTWLVVYFTLILIKSFMDLIAYFWFRYDFIPFFSNEMAEYSKTISNLPSIMIYEMLWSRMAFLRKGIISRLINGNLEEKQFCLRKFLHLYKTLLDNVTNVYNVLVIQAFIELVYYFVRLLADVHTALLMIVLDKNNWDLTVVLLVISLIEFCLMTFGPMFLELTLYEYDMLIRLISTELVQCQDGVYREQILTTLEYLEDRPPRFTIWRIISMNLKEMVVVLDLLVTYIIVLLSFQF